MSGGLKVGQNPIYVSIYIAIKGLIYAVKLERSMRYHLFFGVVACLIGFWLKIDRIEWMFVVISIFMVITAEVINTAIEESIDIFVKGYSKKAAMAKDLSAGAVCVAALNALIIGAIIFLPKIF